MFGIWNQIRACNKLELRHNNECEPNQMKPLYIHQKGTLESDN